MKVALCFSGHIRDLDVTKNYWLDYIQKYDMDVYASFWDVENKELGDTIQNFKNTYNPKKIEVENYDTFRETTQSFTSLQINSPTTLAPQFRETSKQFGQVSMWYKIWRCNMLTKSEKTPYDLVIRCRTDIFLDEKFEIQQNNMLNVPMGFNHGPWVGSEGINDCFAYGIPKIMDYYSYLFLHVMDYHGKGHYLFPPEHFLAVHMSKVKVQIRYFPNYMMITRRSKDQPMEVYNKFINEPFESFRWSDSIDFIPDPNGDFRQELKENFRI
jgi:hypothetical protein